MRDLLLMQNMNQNDLSSSSGFGWLFFHKLFWGVLLPRMTILEKTRKSYYISCKDTKVLCQLLFSCHSE